MFTIIIAVVITTVLVMWVARNCRRWAVQYFAGGVVAGLSMYRMKYTNEMHRETVNAFQKYPTIMSKLLPNTYVFDNTVFSLDRYGDIIAFAQEDTLPLMRMDDKFSIEFDTELNNQERVFVRSVYDLSFNAVRLYEYFKTKYSSEGWVLASNSDNNTAIVEWQGDCLSIVRNFYQYGGVVKVRLNYNGEKWSAMII